MKRNLSMKLKLTLWFTSFMALLAAVCLVLILFTSSYVTRSEAFRVLDTAVRSNLTRVSSEDGSLSLDTGFQFYVNGVYMLLYNSGGALLSGQTPPGMPRDIRLEPVAPSRRTIPLFITKSLNSCLVINFLLPF